MGRTKRKPTRAARAPAKKSVLSRPRARRSDNPCCPVPSDLVTLPMDNPIDPSNPLLRGFRSTYADDSMIAGETVEPYG